MGSVDGSLSQPFRRFEGADLEDDVKEDNDGGDSRRGVSPTNRYCQIRESSVHAPDCRGVDAICPEQAIDAKWGIIRRITSNSSLPRYSPRS